MKVTSLEYPVRNPHTLPGWAILTVLQSKAEIHTTRTLNDTPMDKIERSETDAAFKTNQEKGLLSLPLELRLMIYRFLFTDK